MTDHTDHLWIKICGIRDAGTAAGVADLGADAIGINFYAGSPRCVTDVRTAAEIVRALPSDVEAVGVFVNHSAGEIREICEQVGLTTVQLHGDEPDSLIDDLSNLRVIRAIRAGANFPARAATLLADYANLQTRPQVWLIDARVEGAYGGTGQVVDWTQLAPELRSGWPRLILAGGLNPDNVAEAVATVRPAGVDVASGVESSPGVKDLQQVERFITACLRPPDPPERRSRR